MMLDTIISVLAIWSLAFTIKETDGPFGLINKARVALFHNQYVGVFFQQLLECYFCLGAWCGGIVYLIHQHLWDINLFDMVLWVLAGAAIYFIFNLVIEKWSQE